MDAPNKEFALAGNLEELKAKGRLIVHGGHRPILVIYDRGRVFALDNRCPHMGFPLEQGSVDDAIVSAGVDSTLQLDMRPFSPFRADFQASSLGPGGAKPPLPPKVPFGDA